MRPLTGVAAPAPAIVALSDGSIAAAGGLVNMGTCIIETALLDGSGIEASRRVDFGPDPVAAGLVDRVVVVPA